MKLQVLSTKIVKCFFKRIKMLFTKASEYALLSMIFIARNKEPVGVDTISNELKIPKSFLAKILQDLARDGILQSFKGAKGGFLLAKKPLEISLNEIVQSAEKKQNSIFECSNNRASCPLNKGEICEIWHIFSGIQNKVDAILDNFTLENFIKESNK